MTAEVATVLAAAISAVGGLLGIAIHEFKDMKKKNDADHGAVMIKLNKVQKGVERVAERLDDHVDWHLEETHQKTK